MCICISSFRCVAVHSCSRNNFISGDVITVCICEGWKTHEIAGRISSKECYKYVWRGSVPKEERERKHNQDIANEARRFFTRLVILPWRTENVGNTKWFFKSYRSFRSSFDFVLKDEGFTNKENYNAIKSTIHSNTIWIIAWKRKEGFTVL